VSVNTIKLWAASAWHFDLVMAGVGLHMAGAAALWFGEFWRRGSERAGHRAAELGPKDGAWCELCAAILHELARGCVTLAKRWAAGSTRRFRRAGELAERVGLFDG